MTAKKRAQNTPLVLIRGGGASSLHFGRECSSYCQGLAVGLHVSSLIWILQWILLCYFELSTETTGLCYCNPASQYEPDVISF